MYWASDITDLMVKNTSKETLKVIADSTQGKVLRECQVRDGGYFRKGGPRANVPRR